MLPFGQSSHSAIPSLTVYCPGEHLMQFVERSLVVNVPGEQGKHFSVAEVGAKCPGRQFEHEVDPRE
jgi:hypothetical protein